MPEMDGFTLVEHIKQNPELNGAIIMMLSSAGQSYDSARGQILGLTTYLTKPVIQSNLLEAMLTALGVLPMKVDQPVQIRQPLPSESRPLHILVAEDNVVNQRLVAGMLEKQGHTMVITNNGQEVLDALEREIFDLILMDVQMPIMDGLETTAAIRQKEQVTKSHIPIVAMTAHAMKGDRERCLTAGMDAYLPKPIQIETLFEIIAGVGSTSAPVETNMPVKMQSKPAFEWDDMLDRVGNDMELLQDLIDLFLNDLPEIQSKIEESIACQQGERLRRAAHKLKSSLGVFGAENVFETANALEIMGKKEDFTNAETAYVTLDKEVARLKHALLEFKRGNLS
jgi:CheY-like chemotaxis protein